MAFPKIEGYVITEKIGAGSYSTVYKAFKKVPRQTVAIKCVDKRNVRATIAADNLYTEIKLLKTLKHPHIVGMHDFTWDNQNIYIIMEYCSGGDLSQYIRKLGRVPEQKARYFLQQLVLAIQYLYKNHISHRDLKPHNLLLHKGCFKSQAIKVADFGFAQYLNSSDTSSLRGSPLYMAPEIFSNNYDHRADLWSIGVILYEMLFGLAPYSSSTVGELMQKIKSKAPITLPAGSSISLECKSLLHSLLKHNPDERLTHEELFDNKYLDLAHTPNKENYDQGVLLLNKAVESERTDLQTALDLYTEALEFLIPCAACHDESGKRALQAKLALYMARAEEIKKVLKQNHLTSSVTLDSSPQLMVDLPTASDFVQDKQETEIDVHNCNTDKQQANRKPETKSDEKHNKKFDPCKVT